MTSAWRGPGHELRSTSSFGEALPSPPQGTANSSNHENSTAAVNISALQTEDINPKTVRIDRVSTRELCKFINDEDALVAPAVARCIPAISDVIDTVAPRIARGGKLVYVGAGTSGRLGVVDASEIPPTFSAPHEQFVALMAGGDAAMRIAQEGAEDNLDAGARDIEALNLNSELDSLIGIAASGRTPYVLGALSHAKKLGCVTIGLACAEPSAMSTAGADLVDFMISPLPGPEVVMGSSRMKAGTATKLVLNMLSTGIMIKIGKTYGNMMVDLKASNLKLKQRSRNIIRRISGQSSPETDEEIDTLLASCGGSVKLSLATLALNSTPQHSREMLDRSAGGKLSVLLENSAEHFPNTKPDGLTVAGEAPAEKGRSLVMYIDGGGTKCAVYVVTADGRTAEATAGPCNVTDVGLDRSVAAIKLAAQRALDSLCDSYPEGHRLDLVNAEFEAVWIGLAGHDRPEVAASFYPAIRKLFKISDSGELRVSNDIDVLATAAGHNPGSSNNGGTDSAIVLIAGTGSVSMRYTWSEDRYVRNARSGGWGYLLGDDGGGFDLGRQAIRCALSALDNLRIARGASSPEQFAQLVDGLPALPKKVIAHFCPPGTVDYDLLSSILMGDGSVGTQNEKKPTGNSDAKSRIAGVGQLIMEAAEGSEALEETAPGLPRPGLGDADAEAILTNGVSGLIRTIKPLLQNPFDAGRATLVLSGGLLTSDFQGYRAALLSQLEQMGVNFHSVRVVKSPAELGARSLAARFLKPKAADNE